MKRAIIIAAMLVATGLAGAQMFAQLFGNSVEIWTPASLNPIAWYKAENNALDSAGANNGTFNGSAAYTTGKVGNGFGFDGAWYVSGLPTINTSLPFTISAWINPTNTSKNIVADSMGGGFRLRNNRPTFTIPYIGDVFAPDVMTYGQMVHVALVRNDRTNLVIYVNTAATPRTLVGGRVSSVGIGGFGERYFNGTIDDVLIFDRALTATEITKIYTESVLKNGAAW